MVRLAYKSMRMEVPYSLEDPEGETFMDTSEKIYPSHKKKIEELNEKLGTKSPFVKYNINSSNSGGFLLVKAYTKIDCSNCNVNRANKSCKQVLCKKCCVEKGVPCMAHGTNKSSTK